MSQTKKQKRSARLKAMVPISVLTKEYNQQQNINLTQSNTNCNKEFEDFLIRNNSDSPANNSVIAPMSSGRIECGDNNKSKEDDIIDSLIAYEPSPTKEDIEYENQESQKRTTIKRGRLKKKEIDLVNPGQPIKKPKIINEVPKFSCTVCEKGFQSVTKLTLHYQCHLPKEEKDALKRFHCEYCPRTFKEQSKLNSHRNFKHFKDYKHICEICGRPFMNSSELKRHGAMSHIEKQTCTMCGKQVLNIEVHYKEVHENIPKTCHLCMKVFPNQKKLNKHRYVKHPYQIFECEICEKTYSERFLYKKHMTDKHGIVIQELVF